MKIYHGSIDKVETPEIRESNRTLDYGRGFYTTTSYEQAESWVRRRMGEKRVTLGYISVYEFDEMALQNLNVLVFDSPSDEWVEFVMKNRTQKGYLHKYDLVYGQVANDKVYAAFALYEGGLLDKKTLISELKAYTLVDQYLFHTSESLQYIKFVEAKEVIL
ncbi:MAG: DUF3990 domain-containing protein [Bacteroidales bacterium]|nr:DUF3990 domain-containing protein [Bacteroidales bacterium]